MEDPSRTWWARSATACTVAEPQTLTQSEWLPLAQAHRSRADGFTAAHRERARRGETHPVWDFPVQLLQPAPAPTEGLPSRVRHGAGRPRRPRVPEPKRLRRRRRGVHGEPGLPARPRRDAAFRRGVVEVDGISAASVRVLRDARVGHGLPRRRSASRGVPLRLGAAGTDAVLESIPLRCSHVDAYRFFTRPPSPATRAPHPCHPGPVGSSPAVCTRTWISTRWSHKLGPLVDSGLLMDCLDLAATARELDMRASPTICASTGSHRSPSRNPAAAPSTCAGRARSPSGAPGCARYCSGAAKTCWSKPMTQRRRRVGGERPIGSDDFPAGEEPMKKSKLIGCPWAICGWHAAFTTSSMTRPCPAPGSIPIVSGPAWTRWSPT